MPSGTFRYPSSDGAQVTAYRWDPKGEPRAVNLVAAEPGRGLTSWP